jgi:alkaline phosphatase
MPRYVDGFVIAIQKKKLPAYKKMARKAGKIWMEYGALEYMECIGDDLNIKMCKPFTKLAKTKPGETVVFSYIVYKSRKHRDRVNKKIMADERIQNMMPDKIEMPFNPKNMAYGGFEALVDLTVKKTTA